MSLTHSVSEWVTRSPIELFWTAKKKKVPHLHQIEDSIGGAWSHSHLPRARQAWSPRVPRENNPLKQIGHPVLTSLSTSWPQNNAEGSSSCLVRAAKIFKHQNLQNRFYTDISARVAKNVNFQGHFRLIHQSCEMSNILHESKSSNQILHDHIHHIRDILKLWTQHGSNMEAAWKRCKSCNCI